MPITCDATKARVTEASYRPPSDERTMTISQDGARKPRRSGSVNCKHKGAGRAKTCSSYEAYLTLLSKHDTVPKVGLAPCHNFRIIVATCTGSCLLSRQIGLPLAYVNVTSDPETVVQHLRRTRHGSCQPLSFTSAPFAYCAGWDDWHWERIGPDMAGTAELGLGVALDRGSISVACRVTTPMAALQRSISAGLAHLRLQDASSTGSAIADRHDLGAPTLVTARYTPVRYPAVDRCVRVDDLYVLDPWVGLRALATVIEAAIIEVNDRGASAEDLI